MQFVAFTILEMDKAHSFADVRKRNLGMTPLYLSPFVTAFTLIANVNVYIQTSQQKLHKWHQNSVKTNGEIFSVLLP